VHASSHDTGSLQIIQKHNYTVEHKQTHKTVSLTLITLMLKAILCQMTQACVFEQYHRSQIQTLS